MTVYRAIREDTGEEIDDLFDVNIVDTANPFGNKATPVFADFEGEKFDSLTRGVPIRIEAAEFVPTNGGILYGDSYGSDYSGTQFSFRERFPGYVVQTTDKNQDGDERLEVELYSYDQLLRSGEVSNDQSGKQITDALEDIITEDTPVTWEPANIEVGDPQELTASLRGENVENALRLIRNKSTNEEFGVNGDLEFFFRPRESTHIQTDIEDGNWVDYDIPRRSKETLNEITVSYDDGNEQVTVDNSDKLDLQDSLGTERPVGFSERIVRDSITDFQDAYDVAKQALTERTETLTGTVTTTLDLIDAEPGDTINVQISPRGIDGEFRIAEIEYAIETTTVTIVEKRGNQDDTLVRMSDSIRRVEDRTVDRDAPCGIYQYRCGTHNRHYANGRP